MLAGEGQGWVISQHRTRHEEVRRVYSLPQLYVHVYRFSINLQFDSAVNYQVNISIYQLAILLLPLHLLLSVDPLR